MTITFVSRNLDPNADAGQLYAYVGDAAITRANMGAHLNENAPVVRLSPGSSTLTSTLSVPTGKTVTVFAVEFGTNGFTPAFNINPVPTTPRSDVEFVGWEGNPSTPEPGVAVFTATANRTITANFDRVQGLMLRYVGCAAAKVQTTNTAGLLSFGTVIQDPAPDLTSNNGFTQTGFLQPEANWTYIWGKQGSVFTLRALQREDRSPSVLRSGFIRWDGSAASCGTDLNCQVVVPVKGNSPGPMRLVTGYSFRPNENTYGCNCNPLTPNVPCNMLP